MSPKTVFALLLVGCALLALADANQWGLYSQGRSGWNTRTVPQAPECNCPCGEINGPGMPVGPGGPGGAGGYGGPGGPGGYGGPSRPGTQGPPEVGGGGNLIMI